MTAAQGPIRPPLRTLWPTDPTPPTPDPERLRALQDALDAGLWLAAALGGCLALALAWGWLRGRRRAL